MTNFTINYQDKQYKLTENEITPEDLFLYSGWEGDLSILQLKYYSTLGDIFHSIDLKTGRKRSVNADSCLKLEEL